ncbi:ABC transporter ATP-binding protein/permease [Streptomyces sp. LX-29]|uniref:ABC transporter transmembrane domain-containing protein n=1 Tax=Streptomyces sp. LX-29 TaxID=2900152 RepID=UPI00240DBBE3|nr:ABC transporter ATP-binding protein [Streptomyces sp. LX-29]WFB09810.1 ABC transporter ATP-binding protein/permease [Streptomyces sp. LX-29]
MAAAPRTRSARSHAGRTGHHIGTRPPADAALADAAPADAGAPAARAGDRLLWGTLRHNAARAAAICLLTTSSAAAALAMPAVLGHTLDLLLGDPDAARTRHWIALCAALTGLIVVLDALDGLLTGTTNARSTAWVRGRLLRHTLATGPRPDGLAPGDVVARLVGNAAHAGTAPAALAAALAAVITPVGGLVALALIDPWLAVAFLLGLPLLAVLLKSFVRHTTDSVARYQHSQGEIAARLTEALRGARTIAAAGTAERERARILQPLPELAHQGHRMWRVQGRSTAQAAALVPLLQIAVLAVAGSRLVAGELTVGGLLAASRYAVLATGFGALVGHLNGLVRSRAAARRLGDVLAVPTTAYGTRALPTPHARGPVGRPNPAEPGWPSGRRLPLPPAQPLAPQVGDLAPPARGPVGLPNAAESGWPSPEPGWPSGWRFPYRPSRPPAPQVDHAPPASPGSPPGAPAEPAPGPVGRPDPAQPGWPSGRRFPYAPAQPLASQADHVARRPPGARPPGTLEMRGVGAMRGGRVVLHDVDLWVPGGSSVAVVGRSGSGKSVLAALAGRLADPDRGRVLLDGVPLPELRHDVLRRAVGYAFERPALLGDTLGDTIALGLDEPPPARVAAAARAACADEFIRLLPGGYATPCAAAPLSGGEAQRLGLARAFAHDGRVLVLDDATSSLDTVTERRVVRALSDPATRRTRLVVAHRAATAARADLVAWLDGGRLRAVAPHAELWRDPSYRAVFTEDRDG